MTFLPPNNDINYFRCNYLIYALVPYLNFLFFFGALHVFIYRLKTNVKRHSNGKEHFISFEEYIHGDNGHWDILIIIAGLDILTVLILSIPFIFLDIFFTILLILISIPFKFYPLKYLFGIGFKGMEDTIFEINN